MRSLSIQSGSRSPNIHEVAKDWRQCWRPFKTVTSLPPDRQLLATACVIPSNTTLRGTRNFPYWDQIQILSVVILWVEGHISSKPSHPHVWSIQDVRRRSISSAKDWWAVRLAARSICISSTGKFELGTHFRRILMKYIIACRRGWSIER